MGGRPVARDELTEFVRENNARSERERSAPSVSDAPPRLDRAALLTALSRHGVRFGLVGGLAAQVHGASRCTQDADICPAWTADNLGRLAAALTDLARAWRTAAGDVDVQRASPAPAVGISCATRSSPSTQSN